MPDPDAIARYRPRPPRPKQDTPGCRSLLPGPSPPRRRPGAPRRRHPSPSYRQLRNMRRRAPTRPDLHRSLVPFSFPSSSIAVMTHPRPMGRPAGSRGLGSLSGRGGRPGRTRRRDRWRCGDRGGGGHPRSRRRRLRHPLRRLTVFAVPAQDLRPALSSGPTSLPVRPVDSTDVRIGVSDCNKVGSGGLSCRSMAIFTWRTRRT